jgi:hypothetical protein
MSIARGVMGDENDYVFVCLRISYFQLRRSQIVIT